ncbi:GTP cyclohydrolase 1 [Linum perenne]
MLYVNFTGYKQEVKDIVEGALFPEAGLNAAVGHAGGAGGLVVVRDLDLFSYCESCLLPFQFKCHVGYIPSGQRVVGLSKLSRVADVFAKRLQDPQRLANEICSALHLWIKPADVIVVVEAGHTCMISRGIEKFGSSTATIAVLGRFSTDAVARAMFLQSLPNSSPALGAS